MYYNFIITHNNGLWDVSYYVKETFFYLLIIFARISQIKNVKGSVNEIE